MNVQHPRSSNRMALVEQENQPHPTPDQARGLSARDTKLERDGAIKVLPAASRKTPSALPVRARSQGAGLAQPPQHGADSAGLKTARW